MAQELKAYNVVATEDVNPDVVDSLGCTEFAGYDADEVDAVLAEKDAEIRRLQRALWLARAEKAHFFAMIIDQHPYTQVLHFTSRKRDDSGKPLGIARTAMEWWKMFKEVERKCRAKAEQYK